MATLKKVIKVTKAQYNILSSGGRVGDYVGLNDDYLYLIEDNTEYVDITTVDFPNVATYLDWDATYTLGSVAGQHIRVTMPEAPVYSWSDIPDAPSTFPPSAHNHAASEITSGVLADARIPNLGAGKITSGTFAIDRIPNIPLSKVTGVNTIGTTAASTIAYTTTMSGVTTASPALVSAGAIKQECDYIWASINNINDYCAWQADVDKIDLTVSGNVVTFTNAAGQSVSFTTASAWTDITGKPTLSISGRTVTIGDNSTTWTNTAGLSWDATSHAVKSSVDNTSAVIPTASTSTQGIIAIGTASTQAAAGNHNHDTAYAAKGHTHTTSLSTSTATPSITLDYSGKYAITAGGTTYTFQMPAPGMTTVTSSGSGQLVNSISYNSDSHALSYSLIGGSANPITSPIYISHSDLSFINTVGRGGFRSTSATATNAGYAHNGQFNWSNFGGVTNAWGFQITALDIPNNRYNQLRVWQNGLVYNKYLNATGSTVDIFTIDPDGNTNITGTLAVAGAITSGGTTVSLVGHTHSISSITDVSTIGTTAVSTKTISNNSASIASGNSDLVTGGAIYNYVENEGGKVKSINIDGTTYSPTSGVITLPTYPVVPTNVSSFTNDANYVSNSSTATSNALARFDGTTGKLIKNSSIVSESNGDLKVGRYTYNVLHAQTSATPYETIIHTKIKYASASYMPVVRIYGYAYGLQSPIEFKLAFYIYDGVMGWCGAVSMGAWRPTIYIFKETVDGVNYVAIGLKGQCYYLGFDVDVQFPTQAEGGSNVSTTGWSVTFNTSSTSSVIPTSGVNVDSNNAVCRRIPYKSTLSGLTITANSTVSTYNGVSSVSLNLDDIYLNKTAAAADSSKLNGQASSYYLDYNNFTHTPASLPASDVSAWAKAANKPTYTATEVGALPSTTTYLKSISKSGSTYTITNSANGTTSWTIPTVPSNVSAFTNDAGYLTTVAWGDVTGKPSTFTPTAHTHSVSDITDVSTIGTTAVSTLNITTTVASTSTDSQIPTAKAVWSVANAAGKVKEIQINGTTQTISSSGVVNLPAYPSIPSTYAWTSITGKPTLSISGRTITIGDNSTTWTNTNTAGLSWDATNHAVKSSLDNTSAVIPTATTSVQGIIAIGTAATQAAAGNHTHSAYVNQNAYSNIKVGSTTTVAGSTTDTITFAAGGDLSVGINGKTITYSVTLPTQLPASDVSAWAKAASKPTYNFSEIYAGNVTVGDGSNTVFLRTNGGWASAIYHQTTQDEAVVFLNKGKDVSDIANYSTSWIFAYGDPTTRPTWTSLAPVMQIKENGVVINKLLTTKVGPAYNLDVNGTANATTIYEGGSSLSTKYAAKSHTHTLADITDSSTCVTKGMFSFNASTGVLTINVD